MVTSYVPVPPELVIVCTEGDSPVEEWPLVEVVVTTVGPPVPDESGEDVSSIARSSPAWPMGSALGFWMLRGSPLTEGAPTRKTKAIT